MSIQRLDLKCLAKAQPMSFSWYRSEAMLEGHLKQASCEQLGSAMSRRRHYPFFANEGFSLLIGAL